MRWMRTAPENSSCTSSWICSSLMPNEVGGGRAGLRYKAAVTLIETLRAALLLSCAAVLAGCPQGVEPRLSSIQTGVFTPSCTFSACHSAAGHAGDLVLEAGQAFSMLVSAPASQEVALRDGLLRVAPGDTLNSFLLIKLRTGLPARYGRHMPDTGQQLDPDQLDAITEWVRRGAGND